uniref:GOLGA2L5 domain-containing protein n=1 Tax=Onchocerca flexuosa TaxID=387005 RepID=A0A183HA78_9BILA
LNFQATQRDLLDRKTQLDYLQRRSDDLHSYLPGTSPNQPNTTMDKIHDKVRDLEEKIDASIKKSIMMETDKPSQIIQPEEQKEPDVISTASTGGQSLMLEVQEAEDERLHAEFKKSESNSSEPLVMAMKVNVVEASESLMSLYIEMDEIEKELNQSDPLPFKDLHQKKQKFEVCDMKKTFQLFAPFQWMTLGHYACDINHYNLFPLPVRVDGLSDHA